MTRTALSGFWFAAVGGGGGGSVIAVAASVVYMPSGTRGSIKEVGLIRDTALTLSIHFTRAQYFVSKAHCQRMHSIAAGPLPTALIKYKMRGIALDNSIVYDFCFPTDRWNVHAQLGSFGILPYL